MKKLPCMWCLKQHREKQIDCPNMRKKTKPTSRLEYFAYAANEFQKVIHFTRHYSRIAAERHYGDLSKRYRGSAATDYSLTIYSGRAEFEAELGQYYVIDYKKKTLTPKEES